MADTASFAMVAGEVERGGGGRELRGRQSLWMTKCGNSVRTASCPFMRRPLIPNALVDAPFTTRTAQLYGVSKSALRGPAWRQLFRGVWISANARISREAWLAAARLVLPVDAILCGPSAVDAHGVDVRPEGDVVVHAGFADAVPRRRGGMRLRQLTLSSDEVITVGGWLVTSPLRTAFDCARWLPLVDAVVVVDALIQAQLVDIGSLSAFVKEHPGVRWVRRVADVIAYADGRSESPMESRLRLLLVQAGLVDVESQFVVRDAAGRFVARLDLAFVGARVAVEYDGAWHWQQRRQDDRRRDAVRALGWTVLVVSSEDYYQQPKRIVRQVAEALRRAA